MRMTAMLYYLAGVLAGVAAVIYVVKYGFVADQYLRVGLLAVMAIAMVLLGNREARKTAH
jgi:ribose/xylose/arabinose/galactoside ABC-type transport system permease subunit